MVIANLCTLCPTCSFLESGLPCALNLQTSLDDVHVDCMHPLWIFPSSLPSHHDTLADRGIDAPLCVCRCKFEHIDDVLVPVRGHPIFLTSLPSMPCMGNSDVTILCPISVAHFLVHATLQYTLPVSCLVTRHLFGLCT